MEFTLADVAECTGGTLVGDGARVLSGFSTLEEAGASDLSFVAKPTLMSRADGTNAGALIIPAECEIEGRDVVLHENPIEALSIAIETFVEQAAPPAGVSGLAAVDPDADLGDDVYVGPFAVIEAGAVIGDGCRVHAGAHIGRGSVLGAGTEIRARAVIYPRVTFGTGCIVHSGAVIGADGFGYTFVAGKHRKVPQIGGVAIGDDVEIGSNACIDAGTLVPTRIGDNTKIDDLVQVGHNNLIGNSVLLCGQVGLAGSNEIDDYAVFAGSAGAIGHQKIGKGAQIAAVSIVMREVEPGAVVAGVPAVPVSEWRRSTKTAQRFPAMRVQMKRLAKRVAELEARLNEADESSPA